MPDFKLVAPFEPTGDQPGAIERLIGRPRQGPPAPGPARRHGHRKDTTDRLDDREPQQADARPGPQQDPRRPALRRVPRVLPGERGRVLRQLLRLLPARGVPPAHRHLHREGLVAQRRDRPAAPRRHPRPVRAAGRHHRRQRQLHLRAGCARRLRRDRPEAARRRAVPARRRSCATSSTSSTSATTRRSPAPGSGSAATRSSSSRRRRRPSSGSSSSATSWNGSPSSTR